MQRNLVAQFVLRLQDRASGGIFALQRRLEGLRAVADRVRRVTIAAGAATALVSAVSFAPAIREAAAMEGRLRDMGVTAGRTGEDLRRAIDASRTTINNLASEFRLSGTALQEAFGIFASRGLDENQLVPYARNVALVASASAAAERDLANLGVTFNRVLGLASEADQLQAFATAFRAGQIGGFELNNMASHLPNHLVALRDFGVQGMRAVQNASAMNQVLRDNFGSTEQAAAGLTAMLGQLMSDDFRKNASEIMGIDVMGVFTNARRLQGMGRDTDFVEALLGRVMQATDGQRQRLFETVQDQNARQAISALSDRAGFLQYRNIRNEVRNAAPEMLQQASADRMQGLAAETRALAENQRQAAEILGTAFEPALARVNRELERMIRIVRELDIAFPGLKEAVASSLVVLGGLALALGGLGLAAGPVAAGFKMIAALGAALASPIGIAALAVGGAAIYIATEWGRFRDRFREMGDGVRAVAGGLGEYFAGIFTGDASRSVAAYQVIWNGLGTFFSGFFGALRTLFGDFTGWVDGWTGGAVTQAVGGVRSAFDGLTTWFANLWSGIRAPFDSFIGGVTAGIERVQQLWQGVRDRFAEGQGAQGGPTALGGVQGRQADARRNIASGFYAPETLAGAATAAPSVPARAELSGELVVRLGPGLEMQGVRMPNRDTRLNVLNDNSRGPTRPGP